MVGDEQVTTIPIKGGVDMDAFIYEVCQRY